MAHITAAGSYELRLSADDGALNASDDLTVTVAAPAPAIAHGETRTGGSSKSASVSTAEPLSAEDGLYVAAIASKGLVDVLGVDGLGLSWSEVQSQCSGKGGTRVSVWVAAGTPGAAGVVTAALDAAPANAVIAVSRYDGASTVGSVLAANSNGEFGSCSGGSNSKSYSLDFATSLDDTMVHFAAATLNRNHSPGDGFVERADFRFGRKGRDKAGIAIADTAVADTAVAAAALIGVDGGFNKRHDWAVVVVEIQ